MGTVTATQARNQLFRILKRAIRGHVPYRITCKDGAAILISEEDYESFIETLELLSTPGLLKSVQQAKKEIAKGQTYSFEEIFGQP